MSKDDDYRDDQGDFADDYSQPDTDLGVDAEADQPTTIQVKISDDGGANWYRYELDVSVELDDSGLQVGQLVLLNGEKYEVIASEFGDLGMKAVTKKAAKKPVSKPPARRKK